MIGKSPILLYDKTYKSEEQHMEVVFKTIENHLVMLAWNFKKYFHAEDSLIASHEWVRDSIHNASDGLSTAEEEIFMDFTSSGTVKGNFEVNSLLNFGQRWMMNFLH
ncbi:zinc finger BED domain-containing protein 5 [Trichonephila clavipes]|nr:zinc finger BED domain-containing protein 5 [Trichonephila clavipes]